MRLALTALTFVFGSWATNASAEPRRPTERLRADAGACLQPVEAASLSGPYESAFRQALGLSDRAVAVALVIRPSFRTPTLFSLRRAARERRVLRVTRLDPKVWRPWLERLQELQGASAGPAEDGRLRALAGVALSSTTTEHEVDRQTADLFAEVWRSLLRRTQVVATDIFTIDGARYDFLAGDRTGTVVSPSDGSILELAVRAAERLARLPEAPSVDHAADLASIRKDLREALARTRRNERCVRISRREQKT